MRRPLLPIVLSITLLSMTLLLNACGSTLTPTPAPTLTTIPDTPGAPNADSRLFNVQPSSLIHYQATLALGGLHMDGTFGINGKTVRLVPETGGYRLVIDVQLDGNAITGANSLVVNALKANLETDKFPYGHFSAASKDVLNITQTLIKTDLIGTLELHGQTRPIELPISFTLMDGKITASGVTTLDLQDFGVQVPTAIMKSVITFTVDLTAQEQK